MIAGFVQTGEILSHELSIVKSVHKDNDTLYVAWHQRLLKVLDPEATDPPSEDNYFNLGEVCVELSEAIGELGKQYQYKLFTIFDEHPLNDWTTEWHDQKWQAEMELLEYVKSQVE